MARGDAGTGQGDGELNLSGCTLLLLEDDALAAKWVRVALEDRGAHVLWATRIAQARSLLRSHEIDAALLDVNLPDGNGMDLVAELRTRARPCAALVFTGRTEVTTARAAAGLGVAAFLNKPVQSERLLIAVEAALQRTGVLRGFCERSQVPAGDELRGMVDARLPDTEVLATLPPTTAARLDQLAKEFGLSGREREVMQGVARGSRDAEISETLGISYGRTRRILGTMFKKLGLHSRNDFIRFIWERGPD